MNFTCRRNISIISYLLFFFLILPAGIPQAAQGKVSKALEAAREAGLSDEEINRVLAYGYDVRISADNAVELLEILTKARSQGFASRHCSHAK